MVGANVIGIQRTVIKFRKKKGCNHHLSVPQAQRVGQVTEQRAGRDRDWGVAAAQWPPSVERERRRVPPGSGHALS